MLIKILSFDPGIQNLGYAVSQYDSETDRIHVVQFGTIQGYKLAKQYRDLTESHGRRFTVLHAFKALFMEMIATIQPDIITVEDAFAHSFIDAYLALSLVVHTIRLSAYETLGRDIALIAPKESKKYIANDGTSDKNKVQLSIKHKDDLSFDETLDMDVMTEHSADAIACCYAYVQKTLKEFLKTNIFVSPWDDKKE